MCVCVCEGVRVCMCEGVGVCVCACKGGSVEEMTTALFYSNQETPGSSQYCCWTRHTQRSSQWEATTNINTMDPIHHSTGSSQAIGSRGRNEAFESSWGHPKSGRHCCTIVYTYTQV